MAERNVIVRLKVMPDSAGGKAFADQAKEAQRLETGLGRAAMEARRVFAPDSVQLARVFGGVMAELARNAERAALALGRAGAAANTLQPRPGLAGGAGVSVAGGSTPNAGGGGPGFVEQAAKFYVYAQSVTTGLLTLSAAFKKTEGTFLTAGDALKDKFAGAPVVGQLIGATADLVGQFTGAADYKRKFAREGREQALREQLGANADRAGDERNKLELRQLENRSGQQAAAYGFRRSSETGFRAQLSNPQTAGAAREQLQVEKERLVLQEREAVLNRQLSEAMNERDEATRATKQSLEGIYQTDKKNATTALDVQRLHAKQVEELRKLNSEKQSLNAKYQTAVDLAKAESNLRQVEIRALQQKAALANAGVSEQQGVVSATRNQLQQAKVEFNRLDPAEQALRLEALKVAQNSKEGLNALPQDLQDKLRSTALFAERVKEIEQNSADLNHAVLDMAAEVSGAADRLRAERAELAQRQQAATQVNNEIEVKINIDAKQLADDIAKKTEPILKALDNIEVRIKQVVDEKLKTEAFASQHAR